jgi:hypothetical protein
MQQFLEFNTVSLGPIVSGGPRHKEGHKGRSAAGFGCHGSGIGVHRWVCRILMIPRLLFGGCFC